MTTLHLAALPDGHDPSPGCWCGPLLTVDTLDGQLYVHRPATAAVDGLWRADWDGAAPSATYAQRAAAKAAAAPVPPTVARDWDGDR